MVTGGCGFIGSHVVDALLDRGHEVAVLDDLSTGKRENLPHANPRLRFVQGSVTRPGDIDVAIRNAAAVVHLAALSSVKASMEDPAGSHQINCAGTLNVLEACRRHGVRRITFSSTAAVYGNPQTVPIAESHPCAPLSPYAIDKLCSEAYLRFFQRAHGIDHCILRFFNVYGPRQDPASPYSGVISLFAAALRDGAPLTVFGDGSQVRDFVYVKDVVQVVVESIVNDAFIGQTCNVGTGRASTLLNMLAALELALGRKAEVRYATARAGDIRESVADTRHLAAVRGEWSATPLQAGIEHTLAA